MYRNNCARHFKILARHLWLVKQTARTPLEGHDAP